MNKFVLIDHSLKDLGGHYYTYASCVLPAAERAGFACVLATHCDFSDFEALPRNWTVHASFRHKSQSQRAIDIGTSTRALGAWWNRMRDNWHARERQRIATAFAADCAALFDRVDLAAGDHVFMATASELDLQGLALFLESRPLNRTVNWHLQFHVGIFSGRDPEYAAQAPRREAMRRIFREALQRIPQHRVYLYCTTEQLTAQYQRLDVAAFHTLPYPVHPLFRETPLPERPGHPARIACLGHSRREKGYRQLPAVVRSLWADYLKPGRAQLLLQTRRRDLRKPLDTIVAELGAHSETPPVTYAEFPLALDRYAALVRSADLGLLLYDGGRYYSRCSGVLLEMLSAGVPVVVPAGGWLSEQFAEENQRYLESLISSPDVKQRLPASALAWALPVQGMKNSSHIGETLVFERDSPAICEFTLPSGVCSLLLRFRWREPRAAGTYLRMSLDQFDAKGAAISKFSIIEGPRAGDGHVHTLFRLDEHASVARIAWSNAWNQGRICLDSIECLLLSGASRPAGAVGLAAAEPDDSVVLAHDILEHLGHYTSHAAAFATRCAEHHNADQIIAVLTSVASADVQRSQLAG